MTAPSSTGAPASRPPVFRPLTLGALYPSITRSLAADILAVQALGGAAYPICTAHVVASHGLVTDVLAVPTDTVAAQLEHVFETGAPTAAKVGIVGDAPTVEIIFRLLDAHLKGPLILDLTLSGPSGEELIGQRGLEALVDHLGVPHLVTARIRDATLVAGMEIPSLDDAQVAAQRLCQQGARRVLLRCGRLPTHFFDTETAPPEYAVDLYYDGDDFALFEAPFLSDLADLHGASSGLLLPLLQAVSEGASYEGALRSAKASVTEALKSAQEGEQGVTSTVFFDALHHGWPSQASTAMD